MSCPQNHRAEPRGREPVLMTSFDPCDKLHLKPASKTLGITVTQAKIFPFCSSHLGLGFLLFAAKSVLN